jgi:AcrR family transcriptional regulator
MVIQASNRSDAKSDRPPEERARSRVARGVRPEKIVDAAGEFFAEVGFNGTTRALAARMGVSQALIYRYFPSKQSLIDAVVDQRYGGRRAVATDVLDGDEDLTARLTTFYQDYARRFTRVGIRLMVRANLDEQGIARRMSVPLTETVLRPVCGAVRRAAGLPDFAAVPMTHGERELAMALHGSIVFLAIRKFVYRMPLPDDLDRLVALQVENFTAGVVPTVRRLHDNPDWSDFAVPLVQPRDGAT